MPTPTEVLAALLRSDPARPRVTFYDDSVNVGERIELSGKVLANWVSKAANLLQDEFDAGPGTRISLRLPPAHWRTVYWALATWSVGATVVAGLDQDGAVDVVIGEEPVPTVSNVIVVTLAALARQHPGDVAGAIDEARELATYADRFAPWQRAADDAPALVTTSRTWTYADLVGSAQDFERRYVTADLPSTLRQVTAVFGALGSVLLVRHPDAAALPERLVAEGVTVTM